MSDKITVKQAATMKGYDRFKATFDDEIGGDVPHDTVLVKKTSEIKGNRVWYLSESGRYVEIARMFVFTARRQTPEDREGD